MTATVTWGQSAERPPCTVCGKPYSEHGTYPTCASHPYSQDGRCGHIGTLADGKFTGAPCAGAECRNGCVRAYGVPLPAASISGLVTLASVADVLNSIDMDAADRKYALDMLSALGVLGTVKPGPICPECNGARMVHISIMGDGQDVPCTRCDGTGRLPAGVAEAGHQVITPAASDGAAPQVTRRGMLDMQVCVPAATQDDAVEAFANAENPAGTDQGWKIRRQGDPALGGHDERVTCTGRPGCVHIMLDC